MAPSKCPRCHGTRHRGRWIADHRCPGYKAASAWDGNTTSPMRKSAYSATAFETLPAEPAIIAVACEHADTRHSVKHLLCLLPDCLWRTRDAQYPRRSRLLPDFPSRHISRLERRPVSILAVHGPWRHALSKSSQIALAIYLGLRQLTSVCHYIFHRTLKLMTVPGGQAAVATEQNPVRPHTPKN